MYLSKLDIHGFKSFAQKTSLRFTDGLTGIVGPNGSGKTNIVDALRWVIGEQKSSVLRSDGMEQVIFNGTRTRKPLGMAEVSLTIENNKHILPTEFTQVILTRRLFRDGESQYLINKVPCRLRDITDLFMDTGMGAGAYSVIELKMIEQILSERSDDRRHLFEEAAGVVKYKQRRKETLRRLASTQIDLERVQDIVREVTKNVNSLARQAEKAKSHAELSSQISEYEVQLYVAEYRELRRVLQSFDDDFAFSSEQKSTYEKELASLTEQIAEKKVEFDQCEEILSDALQKERDTGSVLVQAQQELAVLRERTVAVQQSLEKSRQDKVDAERQITQLKREIVETEKTIQESISKQDVQDNELVIAKQNRDQAGLTVQTKRDESRNAGEPLLAIESRMRFLVDGRDRIRRTADNLKNQTSSLSKQTEQYQSQLQLNTTSIADAQQKINTARSEVAQREEALHKARSRNEELQHEIEKHQQAISSMREELSHKRASLEFLQSLSESSDSVAFLLASTSWNPSKKITLSDCITTDERFSIAVESALGVAGTYFVVDTRQDAVSARNELKSKDKGKAGFLIREIIPGAQQPMTLSAGNGVYGWVSELVSTDETLRSALRLILGRTALVETLESGQALLDSGIAERVVTIDGETLFANGVFRGGSVSKTDGLRVGKQQRITLLKEGIAELQQTINDTDKQLSLLRTERGSINLSKMTDELRRAEQSAVSLERNIAEMMYRSQTLETNIQQLAERIKTLSVDSTELIREDEQIALELEQLKSQKVITQQSLNGVLDELRQAESNLQQAESVLRQHELSLVRIHADLDAYHTSIKRALEQQHHLEQRLTSISTNLSQSQTSLVDNEKFLNEQQEKVSILETEHKTARSARMTTEAQTQNIREEYGSLNEKIKNERAKFDKSTLAVHELELKRSQVQTRLDDLLTRALETHSITVETLQTAEEPLLLFEEIRTKVQGLKLRLGSLGNVNFLAMEEHTQEQTRLETLSSQYNDLVTAEKNLQDTITEINTTAKQKFSDVFNSVRGHFKELFSLLFNNDGEADIQMMGDDPLEAHIDIIAKPKGKRPHSIEMLSGGEKTLTAIALLFAIYLVKPSPFCILDEVDAPLDDANIDRYLQLIRKFSENTQFLMITHNKKTMEAADTLYGITMEEAGVSKMVSVQLNDGKKTETEVTVDSEFEVTEAI